MEDEDAAFVKAVWAKASTGITPAQCEAAIAADSYRVRRPARPLADGRRAPGRVGRGRYVRLATSSVMSSDAGQPADQPWTSPSRL
jgi:hypothetical protein